MFARWRSLLLLTGLACAPAGAEEVVEHPNWRVHGFLSMGYVNSDGNNYYGHSRGGGSFDYYEAGVNASWQAGERLLLSGQVLARDAGATDDGDPRLDFAFIDWRHDMPGATASGVRLGRVQNPLGFYNQPRDVIFTRPTILLPHSIYFEGTGIREVLFSSDGLQLYGNWDHPTSHTAITLNGAITTELDGITRDNFRALLLLPPGVGLGELDLEHPVYAQLLHERNGSRQRFGISYVDFNLRLTFVPPGLIPEVNSKQQWLVLSAQYNAERWSLTSEYSAQRVTQTVGGGARTVDEPEGIYGQSEYRFTPAWTGLLRYDLRFEDRDDRDDTDSRDATAALRWTPRAEWIVAGEYHYISGSVGSAGIPVPDNPGGPLERRTRMLLLMVGYRF